MPMSNLFLDATIAIPYWDDIDEKFELECHKISNLNTPAVQNILFYLDEGHYLKIKKLGLLRIKEVSYSSAGGIVITCKRLRKS
jgi:hypothetical protein